MSITDDFHQTLQQERTANQHFMAGDSAPVKALWSHADDVTICGGWGAYEKGWEQVGPRLDWAAARFREGQTTSEMLAMGIGVDLAYTVWIDRGQVRLAGRVQSDGPTRHVHLSSRRGDLEDHPPTRRSHHGQDAGLSNPTTVGLARVEQLSPHRLCLGMHITLWPKMLKG